jgi:hypothetical protein
MLPQVATGVRSGLPQRKRKDAPGIKISRHRRLSGTMADGSLDGASRCEREDNSLPIVNSPRRVRLGVDPWAGLRNAWGGIMLPADEWELLNQSFENPLAAADSGGGAGSPDGAAAEGGRSSTDGSPQSSHSGRSSAPVSPSHRDVRRVQALGQSWSSSLPRLSGPGHDAQGRPRAEDGHGTGTSTSTSTSTSGGGSSNTDTNERPPASGSQRLHQFELVRAQSDQSELMAHLHRRRQLTEKHNLLQRAATTDVPLASAVGARATARGKKYHAPAAGRRACLRGTRDETEGVSCVYL